MTEGHDRDALTNATTLAPDAHMGAEPGAAVPLCFVVDQEPSIRHFLSLILHGAGVDTEEFADGATMGPALLRRSPDLIFLNVGLESPQAFQTVLQLGQYSYTAFVQFINHR